VKAFSIGILRWLNPLRLKRALRLGLKSLWLHRLRSFLTVLGIVFGVCSVIAMLAIGEGASYEAQQQIKNLGSQNIILRSVKPTEEEKVSNIQQSRAIEYGLRYADIRRIRATLSGVKVVVPGRIVREWIWNISQRADAEMLATVPWYPEMRNHHVARGRFFTDAEMEQGAYVCVLGADVAAKLFPIESPLGRDVRVGEDYLRVVGLMERPAQAAKPSETSGKASGASVDRIYIPLSAARTLYGETLVKQRSGTFEAERVELHEVTVKVAKLEQVINVSLAIQDLLARTHKKPDYEIIVPLELLKRAERTKQIFNLVLGSIAAISLLVGGIGIMNIMLANVTERTREIGIRRALGAKRRDIVVQFVIEAVLLSGSGGVIGVALGIAIPYAVTFFSKMATIVTLWSPLLAFSISALIGIVFGLYPALRAADMDPVQALRHE
jgi:putative ABC transport system permease protein